MKVAYIGAKGLPATSGADRVIESIAIRMPHFGIKPYIYCDNSLTPQNVVISGVTIIRVPTIKGKYFRSLSQVMTSAIHALIKENYDLIHLHHVESSFVLPILRIKYKVITTSHGFAYWRSKWGPIAKKTIQMMDTPFMMLSDASTCVSFRDSNELNSRFKKKTCYIPNGVGLEYRPNQEKAKIILDKHGLVQGKYLIFVAGRIEPTKGAHLAIEAINRLKEKPPLLIVGDDKQVPDYGRYLHDIAKSNVHFQSLIEESETLFGLMASAYCLIFPSSVEAMSMVLLEAASIGLPIICSDIIENKQVMEDNVLYFKSGNIDDLEIKIKWALEYSNQLTDLGNQAKKSIHAKYSWDSIAAKYAHLYNELIK